MGTKLQVKPGLSAPQVTSIPDKWDPQWFRRFITNYLGAQAGTVSITGGGFSPVPTGVLNYTYVPGAFAIVNLGLFGTSDANTFTLSPLPNYLIPKTMSTQTMPALIEDNGVEVVGGALGVSAGSNIITMFLNGSTTGWTPSGAKGMDGNYVWLLT